MPRPRDRRTLLLAGVGAIFGGRAGAQPAGPRVAAASDLQVALEEIADGFAARGGARPRLSYGSSGQLQQQIRQGAPFDLFFSADETLVLTLAREGWSADEGWVYGRGRLALYVPQGSALAGLPPQQALAAPELKRLALANPDHAPYGRAAQQALQHLGLWATWAPRVVRAENVAQAAQFVATGNADAGLVALALVLAPRYAGRGVHQALPEAWHVPLRQRLVRRKGSGEPARAFDEYLRSAEARAVLRRYGFEA
ncbi:molybdate ABC transporter substrate-binding protein [Inhella gelatinilytica]|uniref:molybdate ABC transporter substrate-binding protein n=1 Tax=Inhella gelatinilytica TaxID=2795030 RepID=UPI001FE9F358|nr:molybdate ABC transporter substrate-binding protein [Inhella gelatinilytica]